MNELRFSPLTVMAKESPRKKPFSLKERTKLFFRAAGKRVNPLLEIAQEGLSGKYCLSYSQERTYIHRAVVAKLSNEELCMAFPAIRSSHVQETLALAIRNRFINCTVELRNARRSSRPPPKNGGESTPGCRLVLLQDANAGESIAEADFLRSRIAVLIFMEKIHSVPAINSLLKIFHHYRILDGSACRTGGPLPVALSTLLASDYFKAPENKEQRETLLSSIKSSGCSSCLRLVPLSPRIHTVNPADSFYA